MLGGAIPPCYKKYHRKCSTSTVKMDTVINILLGTSVVLSVVAIVLSIISLRRR